MLVVALFECCWWCDGGDDGFRVSKMLHLVAGPLVASPSLRGESCSVCLSHLAP